MERAEKVGLGVALAGHAVLFGLLSVGFLATPNPDKLKNPPVEVSLVEEVAIESAAPEPAAEPAQSIAPEQGAPEDAAPPEPAPAPPEPAPQPRPAPPPPAPPAPRPRPAPPRPAPKAAPMPKPRPPQPRPAAAPKAAPARPAQPKVAAARPATPKQTAPAAAKKGTGSTQTASASRPRGSRLGEDFLKGLSAEPSRSTNPNPPAARIGAQAAANIGSAIQRQIQPCANRQVSPGPGANRIRVAINLRINRDGSLAGRPTVRGHTGVDDDNSRYVDRVDDLVIAAVVGCAPLRGLPPELYDVPGGWSNFTLRYKLPG
ncbi:MAG TPA: cell envelope biogenesis protein TolA [Sphingomonas sp.]|jgi:outer membrane biosynthesis protein TonB|uniref:cell envelope biogenesis protein TolA n=1 Tax=Sphingomonas sp. TaxID=28214 RepID=UPI002EDA34C0